MLGHVFRKERYAPVTIDVFLDQPTYDKFRGYLAKNGLDECNALVNVLERGMANYWLQEFKQLKQDYPRMERLFKEYEKDNEVLKALIRQNEQLQNLLEEESQQKKTPIRPPKT